ncbi:phosphoglycolate phosphatase, bacterial [Nautilia profundicola AmH]|uniref:Phosphoglycolate phosphatase n=1 Tax=Nautilia profundicola (strain ATCC BAA-1463 / DSM 18972 / AmH) TaxID=598659 RepID=B9L9M0_NAUPA|nr:phosphoglycolate phosphatase [Nautilia profundicola]ACM93081.1 phosphoglycolate phosphatase, bacterial [Nautilia profundicola AmH]
MELLIFDLDGTLIDSVPDLTDAINKTFNELGIDRVTEEEVRNYLGNGARTLIERALKEKNDRELLQKALQSFKNHYKNNVCVKTSLYPGVKETLEKLPHKKAIVTNKPYEFVGEILKTLGIDTHFEMYIGGESLPEKKPSPMPLLYVCEKMGFDPKNSIMIGDSKNDIIAAKNAQIKSIAVNYGYNYGEDVAVFEPDIIIDEFNKLLEVL